MRRAIDSVSSAMPYVLFMYAVLTFIVFAFGLFVSPYPFFSGENFQAGVDENVAPHAEAFLRLVIIWAAMWIGEKFSSRKRETFGLRKI